MIEIYVIYGSFGNNILALDNENRIAWWINGGEDSFESMAARFHFTTASDYFKKNGVPNQKLMEFYG